MLYADLGDAFHLFPVLKKFVHNVVLFSVLAVLFVAVGVLALGGTGILRNVKYHLGMWDYTYTRVYEAADCKDVDVLFLGSSHCYRTFDTRFYATHGLRTFNLGTSNQTPLQTLMFLRLYLDSMSPHMVVIEVHPDCMKNDGVESSIYLENNMLPSIAMARMSFSTRNVKSVLSMGYSAVRNTLCGGYTSYVEVLEDEENRYIPGGYVERKGGVYRLEPHPPYYIDVKDYQVDALRECVSMLRERGVPYLLVEVPGTESLKAAYVGYDVFKEKVQCIDNYIALRPEGLCDTVHFYDDDHLNQQGVEMYNRCFYDSVLKPFMDKYVRL